MEEQLVRQYGRRAMKKYGQHFLIDEDVIDFTVRVSELTRDDTVLEVGAGVGNLTEKLVPHCKKVIAVEKDPRFARILRKQFSGQKVEVIEGDILDVDIPQFDKCISNIPYQISSPLTEWLAHEHAFSILMYQREFANRLAAEPGTDDYSRISILAQFYFQPRILLHVDRDAFYPAPRVDSALVRLNPIEPPDVDEDVFFRIVKAAFTHKRKKVKNALEDSAHILEVDRTVFGDITIPCADTRVIDLTIDDFIDITAALYDVIA